MAQAAKALLFGALLHVLLFVVAAVLVYLSVGQGALGEAARASENAPRILAQHRGEILGWLVWAGIVGWLLSSFWTLTANRRQVHQRRGAGAFVGGWVLLLGIDVLVVAILLFAVVPASFGSEVAIGTRLTVEGLVFVFLVLGYWASTALLVKPAMQAAVPGGTLLPSLG